MVRHWLRERSPGWRWTARAQRRRLRPDRRSSPSSSPSPRRPTSLLVAIVIPILVADDAVHPPPVPRVARAARGPARRRHPAAASRGARRRAGARDQPRGRPGGQRRPLDRAGRAGGVSSPTIPRRARASARAGNASCPTSRWSSSSRRTARSSGRCWPTSTCSTRPGHPTSRSPITFVVDPRVRGSQLVGADALQPVGEATADAPCSAGRTPSSSTCPTGATNCPTLDLALPTPRP